MPYARINARAVYDPVRTRVLVLGGSNEQQLLQEVLALNLDPVLAWENITPAGDATPEPYIAARVLLDGARLIVFDRVDYGAWVLDLARATPAWAKLAPSTSPPVAAAGVAGASAILDPFTRRLLVFGGGSPAGLPTNGLFALSIDSPTSWMDLSTAFGAAPPATFGSEAIYSTDGRMVVLESPHAVWSLPLDGGTWARLQPTGVGPVDAFGRAPAYDSKRGRIIAWGSMTTTGGPDAGAGSHFSDETWTLSLGDSPAWSRLATAAEPRPPVRFDFAAAYDSTADRLLVFGGTDPQNVFLDDLWALELGACQ
jgi:hypothetical protein